MMRHLFRFIKVIWGVALLFLFSASINAQPQPDRAYIQAPVFSPAVDYLTVEKIANCQEEPVRKVKYFACRASRTLYERALKNAKRNNQPLMIIFGFNRCPYCEVLERTMFNPAKPVRGGHVARYFSTSALGTYMAKKAQLDIPVLRLHARSTHGLKLADDLGITQMAKERGWTRVWSPFVVFVNPHTGAMASESEWEAKEVYCDWPANVAVSLEAIGFIEKGEPYTERKRCPKR